MRKALAVVAALVTGTIGSGAHAVAADQPRCEGRPDLAGQCFVVRGRMAGGNGTPWLRIWRFGTDRMLGVEQFDDESPNVPADLNARLGPGVRIYGDFRVCPLGPERAGTMRRICVAGATRLREEQLGDVPCSYAAREASHDIEEHPACAVRAGDRWVLATTTRQQLEYSDGGLATVFIEGQWHYANRRGNLLAVPTYDNSPDQFQDGLVRVQVAGKMAFYDREFREVIPPQYDWAWPFEQGRALVCKGCRLAPRDDDGHSALEGGVWGYINTAGEELVPVQLTREEAGRR